MASVSKEEKPIMTTMNRTADAQEVIALAKHSQVRLVRVLYCDNAGLIRTKAIWIDDLPARMQSGIGFPLAQQALSAFDIPAHVEGMGPVGEFRLVPDPATFVVLPYAEASACLVGDMYTLEGIPWAACPRAFLRRMRARLAEHDLEAEVGTEHEFSLARRSDAAFPYQPADFAPLFGAAALDAHGAFLHPWLTALSRQEMTPRLMYPEYGPGQMEISLAPIDALQAADTVCLVRETTRAVAAQHGLIATFAPKPYVDQFAGNGLHLHLSLWGDLESGEERQHNRFYDAQAPGLLSALACSFIGGLLAHLPALVALLCASVNSYERLQPGHWSSAYRGWGLDNREAAIRVPSISWGEGEASLRLEVRCADHSANPYLALGALIAAGLDGIERGLDPGVPLSVDPGALAEEERERLGIRRLPTSLAEALDALEADVVLHEALGPLLASSYLAVKRQEIAFCQDKTPQKIAALSFEKY
jgi:glutamine synthetase